MLGCTESSDAGTAGIGSHDELDRVEPKSPRKLCFIKSTATQTKMYGVT